LSARPISQDISKKVRMVFPMLGGIGQGIDEKPFGGHAVDVDLGLPGEPLVFPRRCGQGAAGHDLRTKILEVPET
jgi:hypothetical protein